MKLARRIYPLRYVIVSSTIIYILLYLNLYDTWHLKRINVLSLPKTWHTRTRKLQKGEDRTIVTLSELRPKLVPEPPIAGMDMECGQRPARNYSGFPQIVVKKGHPYTRARTYSSKKRNESCQQCFPYIYQNVLNVEPCSADSSLKALLLITTVPMENTTRKAIRETWGRNTNSSRTIFLFGIGMLDAEQQILIDESNIYGDILQDNYLDTYLNLSLKVLSGLHWWSKYCDNTPYVLRTAGDNFVNMPNLLTLLSSRNVSQDRIIGRCHPKAGPIRNVVDKYYVHITEYPKSRYPPFCVGTSMVLPAETVRIILRTSPNVPYFVLEDIYFALVMAYAKKGEASTQLFTGFNAERSFRRRNDTCYISRNWINMHFVKDAESMYWIWNHCNKTSPQPSPKMLAYKKRPVKKTHIKRNRTKPSRKNLKRRPLIRRQLL